jgi:hypothetical protein
VLLVLMVGGIVTIILIPVSYFVPVKQKWSTFMTALLYLSPLYIVIKFVASIFLGLFLKMSPLVIFSINPHFDNDEEKIEKIFRDKKWSWARKHFVLAMSDGTLPKGGGPKYYAKNGGVK